MVAEAIATTDWQALDARTDERIARDVADDPDAAPLLTDAQAAVALARSVCLRLGLSQAEFAQRFHVSLGALREWDRNLGQPDATVFAYLRVIAREPDMVAKALAGA
jgi:putative transcriptional regulator